MRGLKRKFEAIVETNENFNMTELHASVWPEIEQLTAVAQILPAIHRAFDTKSYKKLAQAVLRAAFLIELVKVPKIETTKFRVRWCEQLDGDPRSCPFAECLEIASDLLRTLPRWLRTPAHAESLSLAFACSLLPYEAPIDYAARPQPGGRIHLLGNISWYHDPLVIRTLRLRQYLTDDALSPDADFFSRVLLDKIKVKTYLTDRVLTGAHKTNREKRWETHPQSVHFAERRTCMAIEYGLVTEICAFNGFPVGFLRHLQQVNILPNPLPTALCPITGDQLSYEAFRDQLLNPAHGKSDFHVGHKNPLKLGATNAQGAGHTAANISWISADGNRIQGSLSLDAVRELIQRIAENYTAHRWWPNPEPIQRSE